MVLVHNGEMTKWPQEHAGTVKLVGLTESSALEVAGWFEDDAEGHRRLGFYGRHPDWWNQVCCDSHRHGYVVIESTRPVGFVDMEINDAIASIAMLVQRSYRNRHVGRAILRLIDAEASNLGVYEIRGHIESDNTASLRCCVAAGYEADGRDDDGLLILRRQVARSSE